MEEKNIIEKPQSLERFHNSLHEHYTAIVFAIQGMNLNAEYYRKNAKDKNRFIFIGNGKPFTVAPTSKVRIRDAIRGAKKNGHYTDNLIKSFMVTIYSEWDEFHRHEIASEFSIDAQQVKCDLMGDLRLIRNCIVHNKSRIRNENKRLRVLKWSMNGEYLTITKDMLSEFVEAANKMIIVCGNLTIRST